MLEKERFLAIKKLARNIREDNKELFKKLEKKSNDAAIKEKDKFIESIVSNMSIAFSEGEQGREEKQIFRANILIPDDEEFYDSYSKDKNIRSLMKKYAVNIEDVMSKITELNIYGKYIEDQEDESDFVDEMVKISPKEAENLLDEIDNLSNTLTNLDLTNKEETSEEKPKKQSKFINTEAIETEEDKTVKEEIVADDDFLDESFENINTAISGFVTDYNNLKEEIKSKDKEVIALQDQIKKITAANDKLGSEIDQLISVNDKLKENNEELKTENEKMDKRMKILEDKLYKSATLLKKLYNGIKG